MTQSQPEFHYEQPWTEMAKMAKYREGSVATVLLHITGLANVQHFARLPLINKPKTIHHRLWSSSRVIVAMCNAEQKVQLKSITVNNSSLL